MATNEIAKTPKINDKVMAKLVDMSGYVVGDYSMGFMYRAEITQEDFFKNPKAPHWFQADNRPGVMYADCDYAFRELMNPERRLAMAAEFERANAYRAEHYGEQHVNELPIDVKTAIRVANEVLDAVALEQEADRLLPANFDDGFWEEFVGEIFAFFDSGKVTDRS